MANNIVGSIWWLLGFFLIFIFFQWVVVCFLAVFRFLVRALFSDVAGVFFYSFDTKLHLMIKSALSFIT
ncbi:MAG: hypothetical protein U1D70_10510 [Methylobacter sp.]|nr:hypothetical protein [Methylobacter sp.]